MRTERERTMTMHAAAAMAMAGVLAAVLPGPVFGEDARPPSAIVDVDVVPLTGQGVLEAQTVLVEDGRISDIGPIDEVVIPDGAEIIDGARGYLIPGLADGHFHVDGEPTNLTLALANGQTTVTAFNASPEDMALAAEIAAGERLGPRIITGPNVTGLLPIAEYAVERVARAASPLFDTGLLLDQAGVTLDPESARAIVRAAGAAGADFIKINVFVNREVFDAVVEEAGELGLPVQGHVSSQIGLEHFIESGAIVHHWSEVEPYLSSTDIQGIPVQRWNPDLVDEKLPGLIDLMKAHGQAFTPTVVIGSQVARILEDHDAVMARPELRYIHPATVRAWDDPATNLLYANIGTGADNPGLGETITAFDERLIRDLHAAGIPLVAGSDSGASPGSVKGFDLAEELELFVDSGLTPEEALESATLVTATVYGQQDEWGTIEVGKEADLVLLGSDPLADISNVRDIRGVMLGGAWLPQTELQAMLDEISASFEALATVQMEPYASVDLGFSGLAPAGWTELKPGVFTRSDPEADPTFLVQLAAPAGSAEDLLGGVLAEFGAVAGGDPVDRFELGALTWEVLMPEGDLGLVVAIATSDEMAYLVALAARPDEVEALSASVLQPAVGAFTPES